MSRADRLRKTIALCVVAAWASLAGMAFADALEDAREVSAREDQTADQVVQQALSTPAVKPASLSFELIKPRPTPQSNHHPVVDFPRILRLATARPLALTLHDPPLSHRFRLFQFLSVYRL